MAKQKTASTKPTSSPVELTPNETSQPTTGKSIVINSITVSQLFRGNQDVQRWYQALRTAENIYYPMRRELLQTFLDVSIDLHLRSVMDKRIRAVKTAQFVWSGLEDDKIKENMHGIWWMDMLELIQSRIFWGPTLMEFIMGDDGLISETLMIPRQNIRPEIGIISRDGFSNEGFKYREGIYTNYILEVGNKNELGLLANIAPYVLMKRQNLSDFSRYNEMFGMPLRVYEYDPQQPGARTEAENQAKAYGSAAYIVLPKGMANVSFPEANQGSATAAYDKLHQILNDEITVGVLGQMLTTGSSGKGGSSGGKAATSVHKQVEEELNLADKLYAEYVINYPFRKNILIPHGYPMQKVTGRFKELDELPKELRANMWVALLNAGVEIAEEDWHEEFDIPLPDGRPLTVVTKPFNPADPAQQGKGEDPNDPNNPNANTNGKGKAATKAAEDKGKSSKALSSKMTKLYRPWFDKGFKVQLSSKRAISSALDNVMKKVYSGAYKISDVDPDLYTIFSDQLFAAVQKGFGVKLEKATPTEKDVLNQLQQNVQQFSAYKDYQFVSEAAALLYDENGLKKPMAMFEKDFQALSERYYDLYSQVEIDTAEASAQMSAKWQSIQADKGTLPLLQFDAVNDDRTRVSHKELDGIIRPVDDPFWTEHYPPLDYNCRCTVRQLSDGEITSLRDKSMPEIKPMFKNNVGKTNVIFKDHPYMKINPADADKAYNNFGFGPESGNY